MAGSHNSYVPAVGLQTDTPITNVTVGQGPMLSTIFTPETQRVVYAGFGVTVVYETDEGLRAEPLARPKGDGKTAFWRIHGGITKKIVTWVAQSFDTPPIAPHPDTQNPNEVLMHKTVSQAVPSDGPDGRKLLTRAGVYTYVLQVPPSDTDLLTIGVSPFTSSTLSLYSIRVEDFSKLLLTGGTPPALFAGSRINF